MKTSIPRALDRYLGSEARDFTVQAKRIRPVATSLGLTAFGLVFLVVPFILIIAMVLPILEGETANIMINNVPVKVSKDNLSKLTIPALIIGMFLMIGVAIALGGLYGLFAKGPIYVGTPDRLVSFRKGKFTSIDWESFSGDITVSGNTRMGNVELKKRYERNRSSKNNSSSPSALYISGIADPFGIEAMCRKRIKEHDPTPPTVQS